MTPADRAKLAIAAFDGDKVIATVYWGRDVFGERCLQIGEGYVSFNPGVRCYQIESVVVRSPKE